MISKTHKRRSSRGKQSLEVLDDTPLISAFVQVLAASPRLELLQNICRAISSKSQGEEELMSAVTQVAAHFDCSVRINIVLFEAELQKAVLEFNDSEDPSNFTLLRRNSICTRMIKKTIYETENCEVYLRSLIEPLVRRVEFVESMVEVNPEVIEYSDGKEKTVAERVSIINRCTTAFLHDIIKSTSKIPRAMTLLLRSIKKRVAEKFPGKEQAVLGNVFFLRFICPAMVVPEQYGFVEQPPSKLTRRGLMLVSKIVQSLVSAQELKEPYMHPFNELIASFTGRIGGFFEDITTLGRFSSPPAAGAGRSRAQTAPVSFLKTTPMKSQSSSCEDNTAGKHKVSETDNGAAEAIPPGDDHSHSDNDIHKKIILQLPPPIISTSRPDVATPRAPPPAPLPSVIVSELSEDLQIGEEKFLANDAAFGCMPPPTPALPIPPSSKSSSSCEGLDIVKPAPLPPPTKELPSSTAERKIAPKVASDVEKESRIRSSSSVERHLSIFMPAEPRKTAAELSSSPPNAFLSPTTPSASSSASLGSSSSSASPSGLFEAPAIRRTMVRPFMTILQFILNEGPSVLLDPSHASDVHLLALAECSFILFRQLYTYFANLSSRKPKKFG